MYHLNDLQTEGQQRWQNLLQEAEDNRRIKSLPRTRSRVAESVLAWVTNHLHLTHAQPQLVRE